MAARVDRSLLGAIADSEQDGPQPALDTHSNRKAAAADGLICEMALRT